MRQTDPNPLADQFKYAPADNVVRSGWNTIDPDVMPPVLDEARMPDGETWRICMSGPVDHDKRDGYFILAAAVLVVVCGALMWLA
jgi:hypothetical protein